MSGIASAQPAAGLKTRTPGRSHFLAQFSGAPGAAQLAALSDRGAAVLSYVPDFALSISASNGFPADELDIESIGWLQPENKISPQLGGKVAPDTGRFAVVEFYSDVDPSDARAIANQEGLVIQENPDLLANHLLVSGSEAQMLALAGWDEVAYIFPASADLVQGNAVRACAGALTNAGPVGQSVPLVGDGWDGPGLGSADLKYAFAHTTEKLPADATEAEIVRAFSEWSKYAKVTFAPASAANGPRTLAILFASGAHGDGYPFDGPGGVVAHTFYPFPVNAEPLAGDMHFDDDETWRIGADIDVFSIALHETGHALGLGHSDNPNAVMYPYYHLHTALTPDDIAAIQQLYAAQDPAPAPAPNPAPQAPPPPPASPLLLVIQTPPSSTTASSVTISGATSGGSGPVGVNWSTNQGYSGTAQGSANWTIGSVPLNAGDNVITVTARDSLQNQVNESVTVTRTAAAPPPAPAPPAPAPPPGGPDTTAPSLTVLAPASTTLYTSAASIVVSGTATDNVGVAKVTWSSSTGGSGAATGTVNWSTQPIQLYVGTTTIVIRAYDAAGNTSWRSLVVTRN